jgi:MFS family permease
VQGVASSITWIAVSTIVADLAGGENRGKEMGAVNEHGSRGELLGAFAGFFLLNAFAEETGWMAAFLIYALMAAAASWLAWKRVPETRPAGQEKAPEALGTAPVPRAFVWLLAIVFTTVLAQSLLGPIYLIYLQDKFTTDYRTLGLAFIPAGIVFSVLPSRLGGLSDRFGRTPFMALGLLGSGALYLLLPALPGLVWLIALYTLSAVGWAMAGPAESALVADLIGSEQRGRA